MGSLLMMAGCPGSGKALPNKSYVLTPMGKEKVKNIKIGDYLVDRKGNPTKVLGVFPQGELDEYQITFQDGRVALCSEDHLWSCFTSRGNLKTLSTKEMIKEAKNSNHYNFFIPINEPVQYSTKNYLIHPYVIGAFLGDQRQLTISSEDDWIPNKINSLIQEMIKHSFDKRVPPMYLYGDIQQRKELLQGIIDTNGTVDNKGCISIFTNSKNMKNDLLHIIYSLGYLASVSIDNHKKNTNYIIHIMTSLEEKETLVSLPRKKKQITKIKEENKKQKSYKKIAIKDIQKTGNKVSMTCFLVDNKEHLFLLDNFIPTHNTTFAKKMAKEGDFVYISRDEIRFELLGNPKDEVPTDIYFSREGDVYNELWKRTDAALGQDKTVIVDATHLNKRSRDWLLNHLKNYDFVALYIMKTPLEVCLERNETRKGTRAYVPPERLRQMYFAMKDPNILDEFFDEIFLVNEEGEVYGEY